MPSAVAMKIARSSPAPELPLVDVDAKIYEKM